MAEKQTAEIAATRSVKRIFRSELGKFHIGGHLAQTDPDGRSGAGI
jgi:hypothetical protein